MKVLTFCPGIFHTNTYFCFDGSGHCVVIDPGMEEMEIYKKLMAKGLTPSFIFLTHGHFDHSQGAKLLAEKTGAKICIHQEDALMLSDPLCASAHLFYGEDLSSYPRTRADVLLDDNSVISCGDMKFTVLHTPGHTPGSVCFQCDGTLFCGDTIMSNGYGRYDLWGGDRSALARSLFRICQLEGDYRICPGHGNSTTLERARVQIPLYVENLSSRSE